MTKKSSPFIVCLISASLLISCQTPSTKVADGTPKPIPENCPADLGVTFKDLASITAQKVDEKGVMSAPQSFDLSPLKGKVVIFRLIGTWCPYCKNDLAYINQNYLKTAARDQVELVLLTNSSRRETAESVKSFRDLARQQRDVDPRQVHLWYIGDEGEMNGVKRLAEWKQGSGELLFPDYRGVPYGMIFDRYGRLRFRGLFTGSTEVTAAHYAMVDSLTSGKNCAE